MRASNCTEPAHTSFVPSMECTTLSEEVNKSLFGMGIRGSTDDVIHNTFETWADSKKPIGHESENSLEVNHVTVSGQP